jgi:exonuclease SbcD
MRVAHISDTHLGYLQYRLIERKNDYLKAFKQAVEKILDLKVDLLIHTGDLFETFHPDVETLSEVISVFRKIKDSGIPVVAIPGNHDRALRRGYSPPHRILKELDLLTLIDPVGDVYLKDVYIAGMRYFPKTFMDGIRERFFEEFSKKAEESGLSIFMFHQGLDQYLYYESAYELGISELPDNFTYYAGGHIHAFIETRLKGGILSFPGSTEFRSKKEAKRGRRGFNVVDLENGKIERVELENLREFLILETNEEKAYEDLKELLEKAKSCNTKPVIIVDYTYQTQDLYSFQEILEELRKFSLVLKVSESRIHSQQEETVSVNKSYGEIFEEFMKSKGITGEALNIGKQIVESSPEDVHQIVEGFLKSFLKETFDEFKEFSESSVE